MMAQTQITKENLYDMTKKELLVQMNSLKSYEQARWKNQANKDELIGFLTIAIELGYLTEVA